MKKIIAICLVSVMLLSIFAATAFALYGDIYNDNKVDGKDAVKLAQRLANWDIDFSAEDEKNADVYYDGVVNAKDAVKLAQYLANWSVTLGPTGNVGDGDDGNGSNISGGDIEVGAGDIFG